MSWERHLLHLAHFAKHAWDRHRERKEFHETVLRLGAGNADHRTLAERLRAAAEREGLSVHVHSADCASVCIDDERHGLHEVLLRREGNRCAVSARPRVSFRLRRVPQVIEAMCRSWSRSEGKYPCQVRLQHSEEEGASILVVGRVIEDWRTCDDAALGGSVGSVAGLAAGIDDWCVAHNYGSSP